MRWMLLPAFVVTTLASRSIGQNIFANFETPPVHPLEMTPDGTRLLVANTPDARIEVFTLGGALPVWTASIPVGLEPTSVRCRSNTEAWVVNNLSDSVSIVNLGSLNATATLHTGDEPFDVVFAGSPQRAFVSAARPNQLWVFDPGNITAAPTVLQLLGARPRALATDGSRVFAAFFEAGNRTTIAPQAIVSSPATPYAGVNPPPNSGGVPGVFSPPLAPGLPPMPAGSLVMNKEGTAWKDSNLVAWSPSLITWGNLEHHAAIVDATSLNVTYASTALSNVEMSMAVQPSTGRVAMVGAHLTNYVRFESNVRSQFAKQTYYSFDPANPPTQTSQGTAQSQDLNKHLFASPPNPAYLTSATPAQVAMSIADPRAIVFTADGATVFIAGMDSNNVGRFTVNGMTRTATISVGQGPAGLALDAARSRLYVLNRFDGTVSSINTSNNSVVGTAGFFDPTPAPIKLGRPLLYDSHQFSRLGQASCASCHVDARTDAQAWDLGDPSASVKPFDAVCNDPSGVSSPAACNDWHPVKGPMMTQSLVGIVGDEPLHWRGDRLDIGQFSVGYTGLLGLAAPPSPAQMDQLKGFLATLRLPPNPYRTIGDTLPAVVPGLGGNPSSGAALFTTPGTFKGVASCVQCHANPDGSSAIVIPGATIDESQGINIPSLRELYTKTGFSYASTQNTRAFGFTHDASADTVFDYLQRPKFSFAAGQAGDQQRRDLEAYLMCFPTGTHPATGVQVTFAGADDNDPTKTSLLNTLQTLADQGAVGLIAKGVSAGLERGYVYLAGTGTMQSDRKSQSVTIDALRQAAASGSEITFTAVVAGAQVRMGVDRDADGHYDRDELDHGSNPNDPASIPPPCTGDVNGDGVVNTVDLGALLAGFGSSVPPGTHADLNADGVVNTIDLGLLLGQFGGICP